MQQKSRSACPRRQAEPPLVVQSARSTQTALGVANRPAVGDAPTGVHPVNAVVEDWGRLYGNTVTDPRYRHANRSPGSVRAFRR
jgi:hypothetical protein